jgi:aspartate racemase
MSSPKEIDSLINQKQLQSQKTIGMIGGTSWESTLLYYKLINESIRDRLGGLSSAKLLLYSLNYDPIVNLERKNKWDEVGQQIEISAKILQKAGADFLILCCNTLHKVTAYIESAIKIPFLHIADAAGKKLSNTQIKKIGLLGTLFTMRDGFYASRLKDKFGLEVIVPDLNNCKKMDNIIYHELCLGKVLPSSKKEAIDMIQDLQNKGAESILLACTELGMLLGKKDVNIPLYDTALLHVEETVNFSLQLNSTI